MIIVDENYLSIHIKLSKTHLWFADAAAASTVSGFTVQCPFRLCSVLHSLFNFTVFAEPSKGSGGTVIPFVSLGTALLLPSILGSATTTTH
ncbi:hypothetical protein SESBI_34765 [Sesbania bispinosa]|nr:hypothetical protein SESBI_34765 [Sesbania bispinosa]